MSTDLFRINYQINAPVVLLIGENGINFGKLTAKDALKKAQELGYDLVEVEPKANPPVCKLLDFGKFKYEQKKKLSVKKQKERKEKEIQLRPNIEEHDLQVKIRKIIELLEDDSRVKIVLEFKGRERILHSSETIVKLLAALPPHRVMTELKYEGNRYLTIIEPLQEIKEN